MPCLIQYVEQPQGGQGDGDQYYAREHSSAELHSLCLYETAMGGLNDRDKGEIPEHPRRNPHHEHHNSIMKVVELLYERGRPVL